MKVAIDDAVCKAIPELKIFFKTVQLQAADRNIKPLDSQSLARLELNKNEVAEYRAFRGKIAGNELLAVERLKSYGSISDLPSPDRLTNLVIQASYHTNVPITIFSVDEFDSVSIRFAIEGDVLKTKKGDIQIKPHSLIADTEHGILGVLGIKSSFLGKLNPDTQQVAVLSFGCSQETNKKSMGLVEQITQELQTRHYIKKFKAESGETS